MAPRFSIRISNKNTVRKISGNVHIWTISYGNIFGDLTFWRWNNSIRLLVLTQKCQQKITQFIFYKVTSYTDCSSAVHVRCPDTFYPYHGACFMTGPVPLTYTESKVSSEKRFP